MSSFRCSIKVAILAAVAAQVSAADLSPQLKAIHNVSREGQGNDAGNFPDNR